MGVYKILNVLFGDVIPDADARKMYKKKSPPSNST